MSSARDDPGSFSWALGEIQDDQGRLVDFGFGMHGELWQVMSNKTYSGGQLTSYCEADYYPDGTSASHGWLGEVKNVFWRYTGGLPAWSSTVLSDNQYGYDQAGNRLTNAVTLNGASRTETYGYDELNRLTSVNYGDGGTQSYSFDSVSLLARADIRCSCSIKIM